MGVERENVCVCVKLNVEINFFCFSEFNIMGIV